MYTTKPLSLFKSQPEAAARPPPEGRNSGYIVVQGDEDGDDGETCCWDQCGGTRVRDLPFPQDRMLTLHYTELEHHGQSSSGYTDSLYFMPVPDQPIASNRYYAVVGTGERRGYILTCSSDSEEDVKPGGFYRADVYQQIEVVQHERGQFTAKAVAADGFLPLLYRNKYWHVCASKTKNHLDLGDALGINAALRSRQLADTSLPTAMSTVVGKWYCPFYLIHEEYWTMPDQIDERGLFYEVALEQRWEPVQEGSRMYSTRMLIHGVGPGRNVSRGAERERQSTGFVGFRVAGACSVGVCRNVWDRMLWEVYDGGWFDGEEEAGKGAGRSVLVERFLVKTMKGHVVVAIDFVHLNKVRGNTTSGP